MKYPFSGMLNILIKNGTSKDDIKTVTAALIAMGLFGGLGSRSRKGYGSFNLEELKLGNEVVFKAAKDVEELKKAN